MRDGELMMWVEGPPDEPETWGPFVSVDTSSTFLGEKVRICHACRGEGSVVYHAGGWYPTLGEDREYVRGQARQRWEGWCRLPETDTPFWTDFVDKADIAMLRLCRTCGGVRVETDSETSDHRS